MTIYIGTAILIFTARRYASTVCRCRVSVYPSARNIVSKLSLITQLNKAAQAHWDS